MTRIRKTLIFVLCAICILCVSMFAFVACGSKKPASLSVNTKEIKTTYVKDETLDLTGLKVTAKYDGKDDKLLEEKEYTVAPAHGTVLTEDTTVTVSYKKDDSIKTSFKVKVTNNVVSLEIEKGPDKTDYWSNEEAFDKTGMVIKATLQNGEIETVDLANVTIDKQGVLVNLNDKANEDEEQSVVLSYGGKTAEQKVNVLANPIVEAKENTEKSNPRRYYASGESFNPAGVVLALKYKSGRTVDLNLTNMTEGVEYDHSALIGDAGSEFTRTITFKGGLAPIDVVVKCYIAAGIYIEAESGLVHKVTKNEDDTFEIGEGRAPTTSAEVSGN